MKKAILLSLLFVACVFTASAQKFALIDMEYILKNIPAYEQANTQLNQASQQYQSEVEAKAKEAETLYKEYQKENAKRRSKCGKRKGSNQTEKEIFRS